MPSMSTSLKKLRHDSAREPMRGLALDDREACIVDLVERRQADCAWARIWVPEIMDEIGGAIGQVVCPM